MTHSTDESAIALYTDKFSMAEIRGQALPWSPNQGPALDTHPLDDYICEQDVDGLQRSDPGFIASAPGPRFYCLANFEPCCCQALLLICVTIRRVWGDWPWCACLNAGACSAF